MTLAPIAAVTLHRTVYTTERAAMTTQAHILVPFDGSIAAKHAVAYAAALAGRIGARLSFAHVQPPADSLIELKATNEEGTSMMAEIAAAYPSVSSPPSIIVGADIARAVCDSFPHAILVVGSTHAARHAGTAPSIAEALIRVAHDHPVLIVGPRAGTPSFDGPIAVALDGSRLAEAALLPAIAWAEAFGTHVQLVRVVPTAPEAAPEATDDYLASIRAIARGDVTFETHTIIDTDPVAGLARHLSEHRCSLVAIATHAREAVDRLAIGSITMGLIAESPCTVCAVHPDAPAPAALPAGSPATHAQLVPRQPS
jgi:nucleotide-binding universal stress UspA family protein